MTQTGCCAREDRTDPIVTCCGFWSGHERYIMDYSPDPNKLVRERIVEYLNAADERQRAFEIANAIDSTPDYTREVANKLHEGETVEKWWGQPVIGHPMPDGDTRVLVNNWDTLYNIVEQYAPDKMSEASGKSTIEELRNFIEEEIAIGSGHPLGNQKVYYSIELKLDADVSAGKLAGAD